MIQATKVKKDHAAAFGELVIQDGGRMKPLNTFASELLRKMSKRDSYNGLDANQVFLSMIMQPALWYNVEFIYLKKGNDSLRSMIGIPAAKKYAKAIDFFDAKGNYKLAPYLQQAYATNTPNQFQKDFRNADQELGLLNRALGGEILKIFPVPGHENNTWVSYPELSSAGFTGTDSLYVKNILPMYVQALRAAET
ncbi:MAG: cytochrome C biogenesis protein, partial [Sinomicrobium sp.]|nr:cytochrome C biogenesis protein [Sinomicrobium sp.]